MADINKNEDRTQGTRSRPRPEVKRPNIPPPGGLPMPPAWQQNAPQSGGLPSQQQSARQPIGLPIPPSRQQSVPWFSSELPGFGTTASNIPPGILPISSDNPTFGTMPTDPFGLPDFKLFSIASTSKTGFVFSSGTGLTSIKSPTHLPRLANIKVPNLFGSHPARSRSVGSSLPPSILPRPPNARSSRDRSIRDLPGMSASIATDLPRRAKRPTDLPLSNVTSTSLSRVPGPNDIPVTSSNNFPISTTSKESHKSSNTMRKSDRALKSNFPNSHMFGPSSAESNPQTRNLPGTSTMNEPSSSATMHLPGLSSNVTSPDPHNPQGKLDVKRSSDPTPIGLARPSEIGRTGDSMPSISQHPDAQPKSISILGKFKRFVKKGLIVKKTRGGPEDEESTGLVFERDEDGQEPRAQPPPQEPEKKYKRFTNKKYNHELDIDPILPNKEVEKKCYVSENSPEMVSPTESEISNTSTKKSDQDQVSIDNPAPEPISRSNPTSPATERKCMSNLASETSEQASMNNPIAETSSSAGNPIVGISELASESYHIAGVFESASASYHTAEVFESASASYHTAEVFESASASYHIAEISASASNPVDKISELASASNPIAGISESSSTSKVEAPEPILKK